MTLIQMPEHAIRRPSGLTAACLSLLVLLAGCDDESRVRACLEKNAELIGGQDHVFLTEVISVQTLKSYPDGRATRAVSYRTSNSPGVQSTTCLW